MIFPLLQVVTTLFIVAFLVLHIKFFNFSTRFTNSLTNFLLLVGGYALFMTQLKSIFIIPIIGIVVTGIIFKKITLNFTFHQWKSSLLIISFISLLFLLLYIRNNELLILHEDYLFWIRAGVTNQKFGVENINVFYNTIDSSYQKADLYHHLELWAMNLGSTLNGQNSSLNLFFFAYPFAAIISCLGLNELFLNLYPDLFKKPIFVIYSSLFLIVGFLFFLHLWDTFKYYFGLQSMPISGMGLAWKGLRMMYLLNIVVALFLYLKTPTSDTFQSLLFVSFFYLPVFPILILALFLWWIYLHFSGVKTAIIDFVILIGLACGTMFFYVFYGSHAGTTVSGFSLIEWLKIDNWLKFSPAIIMKAVVIPLVGLSPFFLIILRKRLDLLNSKIFHFIVLLYLICIGVWGIFVKNVDANQAFLLIFGGIIPLAILFAIWNLIFIRKSLFGLFLVFIYLVPGIMDAINFKSPVKKELASTITFIAQLGQGKLLYLPEKSELNSVYDFNERVYTGMNQFILYNSKVDLISVSASIEGDNKKINSSTLGMYNFYKQNSPYYKQCGYVDLTSKCFTDFLIKHKIYIICTKKTNLHINGWYKKFENSDYCFYESCKR